MLYYSVSNSHFGMSVKTLDLRETKNYLIDDKSGERYKKVVGEDKVASNRKYSNWTHSGSDIYEISHPYPLKVKNDISRSLYIRKVQSAVELRLKNISYSECVALSELLKLDIPNFREEV